jgi:Domain of unknown function (DUF4864)
MRRTVMSLVCLSLLFAGPLVRAQAASPQIQAGEVPAQEVRNVRAVIEGQFAAFAADDANGAFAYATPGLREMFGSADRFIEVVRASYAAVYRHETVAFLKPEADGAGLVQGVHLTDADGTLWLAVYRLERQRDRSWRIAACRLLPARGQVT